jgi:hypothetical protein
LDAVHNDKSRVAALCEELNNIVEKVREAAEQFLQPKLNSDHEGDTFSVSTYIYYLNTKKIDQKYSQ